VLSRPFGSPFDTRRALAIKGGRSPVKSFAGNQICDLAPAQDNSDHQFCWRSELGSADIPLPCGGHDSRTFLVQKPNRSTPGSGTPMPSAKIRASAILREFERAHSKLVGTAVILTGGKAGTGRGRLARRVARPANFNKGARWKVAGVNDQVRSGGQRASGLGVKTAAAAAKTFCWRGWAPMIQQLK
jgi:hypothetical protein